MAAHGKEGEPIWEVTHEGLLTDEAIGALARLLIDLAEKDDGEPFGSDRVLPEQ